MFHASRTVTAISGGLVALIMFVGATVLLVGLMTTDPSASADEPAGVGPQPRVFPGTPDGLERRLATQQPAPQPWVFPGTPDGLERRLATQQPAPQPWVFPGTPDGLERRLATQQSAPQGQPRRPPQSGRRPVVARPGLGLFQPAFPPSPDAAERWLDR